MDSKFHPDNAAVTESLYFVCSKRESLHFVGTQLYSIGRTISPSVAFCFAELHAIAHSVSTPFRVRESYFITVVSPIGNANVNSYI